MVNRIADEEFVKLLAASQLKLRAFAIALVRSPSDADDILQNANMALWKQRDNYDAERDFFPWACGMVSIETRRYIRKSSSDRLMFDAQLVETLASEYQGLSNDLERRIDTLNLCVDKLEDKDRDLLLERYRSGNRPKVISERTGCPITTLYSALARIRGLLQRCIEATAAQEFHR